MNQAIIYRAKDSNKIQKYDVVNKKIDDLPSKIAEYNSEEKNNMTIELVEGGDIMSLVEIAEKNKRIRLSEVNDICHALDNLQQEIYELRDHVKSQEVES